MLDSCLESDPLQVLCVTALFMLSADMTTVLPFPRTARRNAQG